MSKPLGSSQMEIDDLKDENRRFLKLKAESARHLKDANTLASKSYKYESQVQVLEHERAEVLELLREVTDDGLSDEEKDAKLEKIKIKLKGEG